MDRHPRALPAAALTALLALACTVRAPEFPSLGDLPPADAGADATAPDPGDDPGPDLAGPDDGPDAAAEVPPSDEGPPDAAGDGGGEDRGGEDGAAGDDGGAPDGACVPDCAGRACGGDGCGGSCGPCQPWERCDEGAGQCGQDPEYPPDCAAAHAGVGCCSSDGARRYYGEGSYAAVEDCPATRPCGWDPAEGAYRCGGSGAEPSGRFPAACGGANPLCDLAACGGGDGCGGTCGCAPGHGCHPDGYCTWADWDGSYQGDFVLQGKVTVLPGIDNDLECKGQMILRVRSDTVPAVQGEGACRASALPVSLDADLVFLGERKGVSGVAGVVQYVVNGAGAELPFEAAFQGPGPRVLEGRMQGGRLYDDGSLRLTLVDGFFRVQSPD